MLPAARRGRGRGGVCPSPPIVVVVRPDKKMSPFLSFTLYRLSPKSLDNYEKLTFAPFSQSARISSSYSTAVFYPFLPFLPRPLPFLPLLSSILFLLSLYPVVEVRFGVWTASYRRSRLAV